MSKMYSASTWSYPCPIDLLARRGPIMSSPNPCFRSFVAFLVFFSQGKILHTTYSHYTNWQQHNCHLMLQSSSTDCTLYKAMGETLAGSDQESLMHCHRIRLERSLSKPNRPTSPRLERIKHCRNSRYIGIRNVYKEVE